MQEIPQNSSVINDVVPLMQNRTPIYPKPAHKIRILWRRILLGVIFLTIMVIGLYFFVGRFSTSSLSYSDTYRLVSEKISQSAGIRISLPKGVDKELAKRGIVFEPQIEGRWVDEKSTTWFGIKKVLAATIGQKVNTMCAKPFSLAVCCSSFLNKF